MMLSDSDSENQYDFMKKQFILENKHDTFFEFWEMFRLLPEQLEPCEWLVVQNIQKLPLWVSPMFFIFASVCGCSLFFSVLLDKQINAHFDYTFIKSAKQPFIHNDQNIKIDIS